MKGIPRRLYSPSSPASLSFPCEKTSMSAGDDPLSSTGQCSLKSSTRNSNRRSVVSYSPKPGEAMTVSCSASDGSSVCGSDDSDSGVGAGGCADCSATTFVSGMSAGSDVSGSGAAITRSMNDANHMTKARFRVGIQSFGNGRNKATKDNVPVTTLINTNRFATCRTSTRFRNHSHGCASCFAGSGFRFAQEPGPAQYRGPAPVGRGKGPALAASHPAPATRPEILPGLKGVEPRDHPIENPDGQSSGCCAGPDLIKKKSHAEGCGDETSGSETGRVLSGTNARLDLTVQ